MVKVIFHTWPRGAQVYQETARGRHALANRTDQPNTLTVREGQLVTFWLELAGYGPVRRQIRFQEVEPGREYHDPDIRRGESPIALPPRYPVVVPLYYWARENPLQAGAAVLLVLGLAAAWLWSWRRQRAQLSQMRRREEQRQSLLAGANRGDPLVGATLARTYFLVDVLGAGGMAVVYKAVREEDLDLSGALAVKVIKPELARDPEFRGRFEREVRLSKELNHPGIVRLIDWGEDQGTLYLVMELVEGSSLRSRIPPGGMEPARALEILRPLMEALAYAHSQGLVHRDLKPENVMITPSGRVKVMDFGLARRTQASQKLTRTGDVLGTPAYMSPEQIVGDAVDGRADQYSVGIMAYELLSGHVAFEDSDPVAVLFKHVSGDAPPLRSRAPGVPASVEAVVMRMLARDREKRYPDMLTALVALEEALRG
jgi:predicted Ser/Thr protein kinase